MEKETTREWVSEVATKLGAKALDQGFKLPYHADVYDDHGRGRVASFEMLDGKVASDWSWNGDVITHAIWPFRLKLESADGEWLAGWIRSNDWTLDRSHVRQVAKIG